LINFNFYWNSENFADPNLSLSEERSAKAARRAVSPGEVQCPTELRRRLV